jgi:predicted ATP-dependent endonuclease of OLD family
MRLKKFEIKSYRSCLKTTMPLNRELTALIGVNGAGKSNLLNGLLLLKKMCSSRYMPFREDESSYNNCSFNCELVHDDKTIQLKGDIIFETDERNSDEVHVSKVKWNLGELTGNKSWMDIPIELFALKRSYNFFVDSSNPIFKSLPRKHYNQIKKLQDTLTESIMPIIKEVIDFFNSISYYSASQFSDPSKCPVSFELEENKPLRRYRSYSGHDQFMLDLYNAWKLQDKEFKRYINTINNQGIGLVDDITFNIMEMPSSSYKVQSGGKIQKIERNRLLVIPRITIGGNTLSPNQLSEGTFKTLALIFYILTDESNLLLIEEPEVCIHHGLLNSVITLVKSQSSLKQIVISTHSDYVLDHLEPEDLIIITREEDKGTVAKPLTKTLSKNDYKALREYLEETGNLGDYWREGGLENE